MRLKFIKDWGPYKAGDIHITTSETTRMWLVDRYQIAVLETPTLTIVQPKPQKAQTPEEVMKFLRRPRKDKMVRTAKKDK